MSITITNFIITLENQLSFGYDEDTWHPTFFKTTTLWINKCNVLIKYNCGLKSKQVRKVGVCNFVVYIYHHTSIIGWLSRLKISKFGFQTLYGFATSIK